jgi:predicted TIM-barrel fold metal-dependent hydrolase
MNPSVYFTVTDLDREFFNEKLKDRLSGMILDAHTHINLPEHIAMVPQSRIDGDWALQSGCEMTMEEANGYAAALFPGVDYRFTAFPFPIREADTEGNNTYIAELIKTGKIAFGLLTIRPEMNLAAIEEQLANGGFAGLKPYPDYVSAHKGSEVSIFDFLPRPVLALAERLGKCIVLHLPRAGRFADENNIRELREIMLEFPNLKIIIAHLGRCFNPYYFQKAAEILGDDIHRFWFDTAAVMNPEVLTLAMKTLHGDQLLFGLDLPILLWHGSRRWTEKAYHNVCRENLAWNKHIEGAAVEAGYTFFVYEQLNNILNVMESLGKGEEYKQAFFYENANRFFGGRREKTTEDAICN